MILAKNDLGRGLSLKPLFTLIEKKTWRVVEELRENTLRSRFPSQQISSTCYPIHAKSGNTVTSLNLEHDESVKT